MPRESDCATFAGYMGARLAALGCDYGFGVPGSYVMPFWQQLSVRPKIVLATHECAAVYMADGWARAGGRLGLAVGTIGPGLTNMITGLANAYRDSIPLLAITGQASPASWGAGAFMEAFPINRSFSPQGLARSVVKASYEIASIGHAKRLFEAAVATALSGRYGPVHLSIPTDILRSAIGDDGDLPVYQPGATRDAGRASHAAIELLAEARRPLIVAGWGCYLARQSSGLAQLSKRMGAPIVSTVKGMAAVDDGSASFLGHLDPAASPGLLERLRAYAPDVVLLLGTSASDFAFARVRLILAGARCIQVDIESGENGVRLQSVLNERADLSSWIPSLLDGLAASNVGKAAPVPVGQEAAAEAGQPASAPLTMASGLLAMRQLLDGSEIVIPDAGNHWLETLYWHVPRKAGGVFANVGLGAMGYAIAGSVGMSLARPDEKVVCVTGDGCMLMAGTEISVAVRHNCNVIFLVFNNSAHGRVRLGQVLEYNQELVATDLPPINFAQFGASLGARSTRCTTLDDFVTALRRALGEPGPHVIEALTPSDEVPACLK